jgi:hypothetical protein
MSSTAKPEQRNGLLLGALHTLILWTLPYGPSHGHHIGKHIQRATNESQWEKMTEAVARAIWPAAEEG